jgi:GNAT superfamily N-acetyltransferase
MARRRSGISSAEMASEPALTLALEPADTDASRQLQGGFFTEIATRYPGWDPGQSPSADPLELGPPRGAWIVAYLGERPIGCAGLKAVDDETAEIRRVFLESSARGRGVGRRLLEEVETHARRLGYRRARLTTGDRQPEALALFRGAGYREIAPFNSDPFASYWLEKIL